MVSREERARRKARKDDYLRAEQARSAAFMPLDQPQLEALITHVDAAVRRQGCDHTRRATDEWAAGQDVNLAALHRGLEEYGGFCDCEVVLNVDPEYVFVPVRMPPPDAPGPTPDARGPRDRQPR